MKKIKISVIVVNFNGKENVERTMQSMIEQSYQDFEVVVIDAASTDGSREMLLEYKNKFRFFKLLSEPDKGIYDGMNKGVRAASGEYVYFLNLGDKLYSCHTLENVRCNLESEADIYYGDVMWGAKMLKQPSKLSSLFFLNEHMICHQSIFARRECLIHNPFSLQFKYCADRDWLFEEYRSGNKIKKMDLIIAWYDLAGVSSQKNNFSEDSLKLIRKTHGIWGYRYVVFKRRMGKLIRRNISWKKQLTQIWFL